MRRQQPTMIGSSATTTTTWFLTFATGCLALPYKSSSFSTSFSNFTSQKPNPNFASANFATSNFATNNYTAPNFMSSNWSQTWSQGYQYQYQNQGTGPGSSNGAPVKGPWIPPYPQPPMTPGNPGGFNSNGNSFPQQPNGGLGSNSGVSRPFYRPPTQQTSAGFGSGNQLPPGTPHFGSNNPIPPYPPPQNSAGSYNNNNAPSISSGSSNNNGAGMSSGAFNFNPSTKPSETSDSKAPQIPSVGSSFNAQPVPPGDSNSINSASPDASSSNSSSPWSLEPLEPNRFGASTNSGDQPPKRNSVEGVVCRDKGGQQHSVGDKWTPLGSCSRLACLPDGKTSSLGCPSTEVVENCSLSPEDPRQPWPLCCPQIQCTQ